MTYLKRSNVASKRSRAKTIGILFFLLILFLLHFFFPRFYSTLFYPITSILWKSENSLGTWLSHKASLVRGKYSLVLENEKLRREIASNKTSLLLLQNLEEENADLKNALGRKPSGDVIIAVVLTRPPVSPYDTLVIDAGSKDGIEIGNRVYADGDVLVGEIAEVYGSQSKVSLLSSPGKKTTISFTGSNIHTEATGRGSGNFTASVPVEAGIQAGDTVIAPDIKLHVLGVVENIEADSTNSFATILFKMPINIHDIRFVEVQK
jgi:rod shape-determining protein MreC